MKQIVFTDLDGTLLDSDYSFMNALPSVKLLKMKKIPIVFCTSKTKAETEKYQKKLQIKCPFIIENGGGIFIPTNYFDFKFNCKIVGSYKAIEIGTNYKKLREVVKKIKSKGINITGFGDMSVKQIMKDAGLSLEETRLSKKRGYDEPFKARKEDIGRIRKIARMNKLKITEGGRYYHLIGNNDKGVAVKKLMGIYKKKFGKIKTIALGDSKNDFKMLDAVDVPFLVQRKDGSYASKKYKKVKGVASKGWGNAVRSIFV